MESIKNNVSIIKVSKYQLLTPQWKMSTTEERERKGGYKKYK